MSHQPQQQQVLKHLCSIIDESFRQLPQPARKLILFFGLDYRDLLYRQALRRSQNTPDKKLEYLNQMLYHTGLKPKQELHSLLRDMMIKKLTKRMSDYSNMMTTDFKPNTIKKVRTIPLQFKQIDDKMEQQLAYLREYKIKQPVETIPREEEQIKEQDKPCQIVSAKPFDNRFDGIKIIPKQTVNKEEEIKRLQQEIDTLKPKYNDQTDQQKSLQDRLNKAQNDREKQEIQILIKQIYDKRSQTWNNLQSLRAKRDALKLELNQKKDTKPSQPAQNQSTPRKQTQGASTPSPNQTPLTTPLHQPQPHLTDKTHSTNPAQSVQPANLPDTTQLHTSKTHMPQTNNQPNNQSNATQYTVQPQPVQQHPTQPNNQSYPGQPTHLQPVQPVHPVQPGYQPNPTQQHPIQQGHPSHSTQQPTQFHTTQQYPPNAAQYPQTQFNQPTTTMNQNINQPPNPKQHPR